MTIYPNKLFLSYNIPFVIFQIVIWFILYRLHLWINYKEPHLHLHLHLSCIMQLAALNINLYSVNVGSCLHPHPPFYFPRSLHFISLQGVNYKRKKHFLSHSLSLQRIPSPFDSFSISLHRNSWTLKWNWKLFDISLSLPFPLPSFLTLPWPLSLPIYSFSTSLHRIFWNLKWNSFPTLTMPSASSIPL